MDTTSERAPKTLTIGTRTWVWCSFSFEGFHCWPTAPDHVAFLRSPHRHMFHVEAQKEVTHTDRDIEFITLKRQLEAAIVPIQASRDVSNWSCEDWCHELLNRFDLYRVEVSEDNENGAVVERVD